MSDEQPTPPPHPYQEPPAAPSQAPNADFQYVADKIGFVPNLRKSDNIFQLKFIGITLLLSIVASVVVPMGYPEPPILAKMAIGLVVGLLLGLILSGIVLAIKNLKR